MKMRYVILALFLTSFLLPSKGEATTNFYNKNTVYVVVGYGPGGGYDVYARLLARHFGNHMPGSPTVVVQNMPGAASLKAANHLYTTAPRDGTVIGTFARNMALLGVLKDNPNVKFDPNQFIWLGSVSSYQDDAFLLFARKDAGIKSVNDLRHKELIIGGSSEGGTSNDIALLLKDVLKLNLKLINGYEGNSISLAVDRKEVDGRFNGLSSTTYTKPEWLEPNSHISVLLQFGRASRHPMFPNVPTAQEIAPDQKALDLIRLAETPYMLSRPFVAPPDIPKDRADALKKAFAQTVLNPEYLEEGKKLKLDLSAVGPDQATALISALSSAPPNLLEYLKNLQ